MPKLAQDTLKVDLAVVDPDGNVVKLIKNQTITPLERFALNENKFSVEIANGRYEDPEAYAE